MVYLIKDLTVTQDGFRNDYQITDMIAYAANGGAFHQRAIIEHKNNHRAKLITIAVFQDGRKFIHDGHHRVASIYLSGRDFLYNDEVELKHWSYNDYIQPNLGAGWITPFDPRIEVRISDYTSFKNTVTSMAWRNNSRYPDTTDTKHLIEWILKNKSRYSVPRRVLSIQDMLRSSNVSRS